MEITSTPFTIVEKELIEKMHFPQQEVLTDLDLIKDRNLDAQKAMKLGNSFKDKIKIVFEDHEGVKMVVTTIWGVTEKYVMLKRGMTIPLHRIHQIII